MGREKPRSSGGSGIHGVTGLAFGLALVVSAGQFHDPTKTQLIQFEGLFGRNATTRREWPDRRIEGGNPDR